MIEFLLYALYIPFWLLVAYIIYVVGRLLWEEIR